MTNISKIRDYAEAILAETREPSADVTAPPTSEPATDPGSAAEVPADTRPAALLVPATPMEAPAPVDRPMAIMNGVLKVGAADQQGMKVVGRDPLPQGIVATEDLLVFESFTGDFYDDCGWDIGNRQVLIKSLFGAFGNIRSTKMRATLIGKRPDQTTPGIWVQPGGGFSLMEHVTVEDCMAPMILKQEIGAAASVVRLCDLFGMSQDALKTSGGNLVELNRFGPATYRGGLPHSDANTFMAAYGASVFRQNVVDWRYAGRVDQSGINNIGRIEPYKAGSRFDDIVVEENLLLHGNPRSFGFQILTKNNPNWVGGIHFRGNRIKKAGGNNKILYAATPRIVEWSGNIDLTTGAEIALSAA